MAGGCIYFALMAGRERASRKWAVRKRDGMWRVYEPENCCPVFAQTECVEAIRRAQELARGF